MQQKSHRAVDGLFSSESNVTDNFSRDLNGLFKVQIFFEVSLIFIISLTVSAVRLNESLWQVVTTYPGQPKILVLPLCWYVSLYVSKAWIKIDLLYYDRLYSKVLKAAFTSLTIFAVLVLFSKYPIPRSWIVLNFVWITLGLLSIRFIFQKILFKEINQYTNLKYIFIGDVKNQVVAFREFEAHFGFVPQFTVIKPPTKTNELKWLRDYQLLSKKNYFGVFIDNKSYSNSTIMREISNCNRKQILDMILISDIAMMVPRFDPLDNPALIRIAENSLYSTGALPKRLVDIFLSIVALITLSPLFLIIFLAIKITSPGPALFRQKRLGHQGKLFTFIKFRSMYLDSELNRSKVLGPLNDAIRGKYKADPRITPLGKFIRRWSIDELPQFWIVLKGEMSIVGPRPILLEETNQVQNNFAIRFMAKPGLTGLWQVTGRKEVLWEDRMVRDLEYIENWSLWKDTILILKTFLAVIKGNGAY